MIIAHSSTPDTAPITPAPDSWETFVHWEASTSDAIDVKRAYIRAAGGDHVAGVLLSQLSYWNQPSKRGEIHRLSVQKKGKFWLVKKRTDWRKECEISPKQFDRARKVLVNRGLITVERWRYRGSPTLHIHLHIESLLTAVKALESPGPCNVSPGEIGICPKGKLEFAQRGNSLRPKIGLYREKSKPLPLPSLPLFQIETENPSTGFSLDEGKQTEITGTAPQFPVDHQIPVCAIEGECAAPAPPAPPPAPEEPAATAAALPDDPLTAEECEARYHTLPADQQAALREEAIERLVDKGYRRDFMSMLILTEICYLIATQIGGCVAEVPAASAVRPPPQLTTPPRPTPQPARSGKASLPAPNRNHLLLEDLEDISRLLMVYKQAIDRGEVGRSEAERLKFCATAQHALRCGEDPPALFADNIKHQRWHCDQSDEDTAQRELRNHFYGCDAPRSAPPVPASAPPTLTKDAWCVRKLQQELARHAMPVDVWSYLRQEEGWTQERCVKVAHELQHYERACQQGNALSRLGNQDPQEEWQGSPCPADVECLVCGELGAACACRDGEDV